MNLKSLRKLLAVGLVTVAGYCWGTPSLPQNDDPTWQDISSIQWSTNNGANWGNSALVVGQSVEFKITMHKNEKGNHYADLLKVWVDFSGDQVFQTGEAVLFGAHVDNASVTPWNGPGNYVVNQSFDFKSGPVTLTNAMIGDHFLLARVTCSDSLLSTALGSSYAWNSQWSSVYTSSNNAPYGELFSPTAHYGQGESELVKLTVNRVPEPGTLSLLVAAMVGMGLRRKQAPRV
jgi:hypothetical protein